MLTNNALQYKTKTDNVFLKLSVWTIKKKSFTNF